MGLRARTLPGIAAVVIAGVVPMAASPAHAEKSESTSKTKMAGCLGHGPARSAQATLWTGVTYSARHLEGYSNAYGRGTDCQHGGGVTTTTTMANHGHVEGRKITSCTVSARGGCTVNPADTYAQWNSSLPKRRTNASGRHLDISGIEVWASSTGRLNDWYATATTTIYVGNSTVTANATVHWDL